MEIHKTYLLQIGGHSLHSRNYDFSKLLRKFSIFSILSIYYSYFPIFHTFPYFPYHPYFPYVPHFPYSIFSYFPYFLNYRYLFIFHTFHIYHIFQAVQRKFVLYSIVFCSAGSFLFLFPRILQLCPKNQESIQFFLNENS